MRTIAFVGGGTAGHVMPNLALIKALRREYACVYIGGDGMEKQLCLSRGIPFYTIKTVKLRRDAVFKNLAVPFKLSACVKSAKKVLDEIKPDLIFGKGGYAALPVILAAGKIPVISHESDFSPGLVTKLAKRKSKYVLCAFEPCAARFKNGIYCGTPLNPDLYSAATADKTAARKKLGLDGKKPTLAIIGGSSGAQTLNDRAAAALPELLKVFDVLHVVGKNKSGGAPQKGYTQIEFCDDMPSLYACCDVIVTRAGANALAECIALKIPALAVPLEKASRGDQLQNAEYYAGLSAIKVMRERDMSTQSLAAAALELYNCRSKYVDAMSALQIDGTEKICDIIRKTIETQS